MEAEKEIARLNAESIESRRRLEMVEAISKKHEDDIRALFAHQEGTKAYVSQILQKLDQLETKFFNLVTSMNTAAIEERKATVEAEAKRAATAAQERATTTTGWQSTVKDIIKLTVAAIIGYLFSQGG